MGMYDTEGETGRADAAVRTISCELVFNVVEAAEIVLQVVASGSAGRVVAETFQVQGNGVSPSSLVELRGPYGARIHVVHSVAGCLTVAYRSEIDASSVHMPGSAEADVSRQASQSHERLLYLRPSRYCPSDHLTGFAMSEFGSATSERTRVAAITDWIRRRIDYVLGSSTVHDSAEDTVLTGMGTCRDFAHLGIALCRATGVAARFVAVYAPGLAPMDFHAVFEAFEDGSWCVHDATGLAPRSSLVRVATGRDAADCAFADIISGVAHLDSIRVGATVGSSLPVDDHSHPVQLA